MGSEAPPDGGPAARIAAFVPRQRLQGSVARGHGCTCSRCRSMRLRWGAKRPQAAVLRPASQPSYLVSDYRELRRVGMAVLVVAAEV